MDTNAYEYPEREPDLPRKFRAHREVVGLDTAQRNLFYSCRFVFIRGSTELFRVSVH